MAMGEWVREGGKSLTISLGTLVKGGLRITPIDDGSCEVGFIVAINPRGWIPLWVANACIGDEPLVLRKLEEWAQLHFPPGNVM
ncbi:hypothetical protein M1146_07630 [Patescibacteria group bacterium]|nr:hypothetical protein [Patescibacteria group bacterium]